MSKTAIRKEIMEHAQRFADFKLEFSKKLSIRYTRAGDESGGALMFHKGGYEIGHAIVFADETQLKNAAIEDKEMARLAGLAWAGNLDIDVLYEVECWRMLGYGKTQAKAMLKDALSGTEYEM